MENPFPRGEGSTNAKGGNCLVPRPVWPAVPQVPVMRKASKTQLVWAGISLAALGPLVQAASAATVLSIGDGDTISARRVL